MAMAKARKVRVTVTVDSAVLARARWLCKKSGVRLAHLIALGIEARLRRIEADRGLSWHGQRVRLRAGRPPAVGTA